jgi:hypothetical protein
MPGSLGIDHKMRGHGFQIVAPNTPMTVDQ